MSIDIMNRILWREDLPTMEKFVGLCLASMADDDYYSCYPTKETVARLCGCVPRTVTNCTQRLEEKGLLRVVKRRDLSNVYIFRMENLPHVERPRGGKKERRDGERQAWMPEEPGLFGDEHQRPSVGTKCTGASGSGTGESLSTTGESLSIRGERDAPRNISESSEESSEESSGSRSLALTGGDVSVNGEDIARIPLEQYIKRRWDAMKDKYPNMGECRSITESMARLVRERAKEHQQTGETFHDVWKLALDRVEASTFLTGRVAPGKGYTKRFRLTLSKMLKPHIFREIINDGYGGNDGDNVDPETGEIMGPAAAATRGTRERFRSARERSQ